MSLVLKLIGVAILAGVVLVGGFLADAVWNGSGLFYAAVGRDALVRACTPMTLESLIGKGFSPTDLAFGEQPSIGFRSGSAGRSTTLAGPFTFSDGPNGPTVAGRLSCTLIGKTVRVDVEVDDLPRRVT